jgi:hypothetical protein
MSKIEIQRPGHGAYLAWMGPFAVLFGILTYILLITPLYWYVICISFGGIVYKFCKTTKRFLESVSVFLGGKKCSD